MNNVLIGATHAPLYNFSNIQGLAEAQFDIIHKTAQFIGVRTAIYISDLEQINGGTVGAALPTGALMTELAWNTLYNTDPYSNRRRVCDSLAMLSASFDRFWSACELDGFRMLRRICTPGLGQPPHILRKYFLFYTSLNNFIEYVTTEVVSNDTHFIFHDQEKELKYFISLYNVTQILFNDLLHHLVTPDTQWRDIYREYEREIRGDMRTFGNLNAMAGQMCEDDFLQCNLHWNHADEACAQGEFEMVRGYEEEKEDTVEGWLHGGQHGTYPRQW